MKKIWLIVGKTERDVDTQPWIVEAYDEEAAAQYRVEQLNGLLTEMAGPDGNRSADTRHRKERMIPSHLNRDLACFIDRSGTEYNVLPGRLHETRCKRLVERLAVLAFTVAIDIAILWAIWKWQPGRAIVKWLLD